MFRWTVILSPDSKSSPLPPVAVPARAAAAPAPAQSHSALHPFAHGHGYGNGHGASDPTYTLHAVLDDEHRMVEFKALQKSKVPHIAIVKYAEKNICGFLNSDLGGILYCGVRDDGVILGVRLTQYVLCCAVGCSLVRSV